MATQRQGCCRPAGLLLLLWVCTGGRAFLAQSYSYLSWKVAENKNCFLVCFHIWFVTKTMKVLCWMNAAALSLIFAAAGSVQAAVDRSPFLRNNSMLHIMSFNQRLHESSLLMSSDFFARISAGRIGPAPHDVSAAFHALLDLPAGTSSLELAVAKSMKLLFEQQQKNRAYLHSTLVARGAMAKFLAHPQAFSAANRERFEIISRSYDLLSACTRSISLNSTLARRTLDLAEGKHVDPLPNNQPFHSVAYVVAKNQSEEFSRLNAWSLKSVLTQGLAERIAFVGFSKKPPKSAFWRQVKHFVKYVPVETFVRSLNGSFPHLAPAQALSTHSGIWMDARHIVVLPIQGIVANLTQTKREANEPKLSFLASRAAKYTNIDTSFMGVSYGSPIPERWLEHMVHHILNNCTKAPSCSPEAALGTAVKELRNTSNILPRSVLHYPGGSMKSIEQALFYRGKHVQRLSEGALRTAMAVHVPPSPAYHRWVTGRSEETIAQGNTGLDVILRHVLHPEPVDAYYADAIHKLGALTNGVTEQATSSEAA